MEFMDRALSIEQAHSLGRTPSLLLFNLQLVATLLLSFTLCIPKAEYFTCEKNYERPLNIYRI